MCQQFLGINIVDSVASECRRERERKNVGGIGIFNMRNTGKIMHDCKEEQFWNYYDELKFDLY